jgi:hypothetical protein
MIDFAIENHGSIFLLKPCTKAAKAWVSENIGQKNGYQPMWPTVVLEARYVDNVLQGIANDGLAVR